jgi:hypothetical protein
MMPRNRWVYIILALTILDILYTAFGAFYGGGGAELNPVFSWVTNPLIFVGVIIVAKIVGVGTIILVIEYLHAKKDGDADKLGHHAVKIYSLLFIGIFTINIWHMMAGG